MTAKVTDNITYISTQQELKEVCRKFSQESIIGVDFECENNLHRYGAYLTLIQISDSTKDYIIDVIELHSIDCLLEIFADETIEKIFHDVSFDFRILEHEFNAKVRNVTDTQVLALLNGEENIGLGTLLEKYFGVKKKNKFQKADWTKRPLSNEMLQYATGDSAYLIELKGKLCKELESKGRLSWAKQECKHLETLDYSYHEQQAKDLKGYSKLSAERKSILTAIFNLREKLAEQVDMPPHFIINNKRLIEIANNPPNTIKGWAKMRGVHPIVKRYSGMFLKNVLEAKKNPVQVEKNRSRRYSTQQRERFTALSEIRDELSSQLEMKKSVILSKDQIKDIVTTDSYDSLRPWQKDLIREKEQ
ncbi:MAG: ribonuclease D [Nanoarchaeota archaeon]